MSVSGKVAILAEPATRELLDGLAGGRPYSSANVAAIAQQLQPLVVAHFIYGVGDPLVSRD